MPNLKTTHTKEVNDGNETMQVDLPDEEESGASSEVVSKTNATSGKNGLNIEIPDDGNDSDLKSVKSRAPSKASSKQ